MESLKVKICKCGQDRIDHKKNPNSKWSFANECNKCKCNSYLNRNRPDKLDIFMVGYGVLLIGLFSFLILSVLNFSLDPKIENIEVKIKTSDLGLIFSLPLITISIWIIPMFIIPYFKARKRKSYTIEPSDKSI